MRHAILPALLVLAACLPDDRPAPPADAASACGADTLQNLVGQSAGSHDFASGTDAVRIIPPGTAVTMDHRPDRLNVETDAAGTITRIYCG